LLDFMATCEARRRNELEGVAWWKYVKAQQHSEQYRKLLAAGLTRSLVAMKAEVASTRTIGTILVQMLMSVTRYVSSMDRVLNGPTSDVWIDPWVAYLAERGVRFFHEKRVVGFDFTDDVIASVLLSDKSKNRTTVQGDYYIAAMPV